MPRGGVRREGARETVLREAVAWRGLLVIGGLLAALLVPTSSRYGYHRDELYFILIGSRPAWGYADQPALVPLLAHALHTISGGSLVALRIPSALLAGGTAVLTGVMARELGASRGGQLLAGACMAAGAVTVAVGHLLSTSTFDLFVWTLLSLLLVRALRDGGAAWLWAGVAAGVGLEVKTLVAFFLVAVLGGILLTGPREALRSWQPWAGGVLALALWAPDLAWQASNGWPQLDLARGIAAGSSGTSESRWLLLPYQLVLISPFLVPVWVRGGLGLARGPGVSPLPGLPHSLRTPPGHLSRHRRQAVLHRRRVPGAARGWGGTLCTPGEPGAPAAGPAGHRPGRQPRCRGLPLPSTDACEPPGRLPSGGGQLRRP